MAGRLDMTETLFKTLAWRVESDIECVPRRMNPFKFDPERHDRAWHNQAHTQFDAAHATFITGIVKIK